MLLGMIIIQVVNDSLSYAKEYQHLIELGNNYNANMSNLIMLTGIIISIITVALGYFALIVPYRNRKEIDEATKDIKESYNKFDERITNEYNYQRVRYDNIFKDIDSRIEKEFDKKVNENNKKFSDVIKLNFEKLDRTHHAHREFIYAIIFMQNNQPERALTSFLISALKAVQSDNYIVLNDINTNLKDHAKFFSRLDSSKVKPRESINATKYLTEIENYLGSNENNNMMFYEFKELIKKIIIN